MEQSGKLIFLGTYHHTIDEKNRLNLPTKLVNHFPKHLLVASRGFDGCLELRNKEDFLVWVNKILSYSQNKKDSRIFSRQILANSMEIEIDKVNRILIPEILKKMANLQRNVTIIGVGNKLEVWDSKQYSKFITDTSNKFELIAEKIDENNNE